MLDFKREKVSGMLAAHSENTPFKMYCIDDTAHAYLAAMQMDESGPMISIWEVFNTIEEAKEAAEAMEIDAMRESK